MMNFAAFKMMYFVLKMMRAALDIMNLPQQITSPSCVSHRQSAENDRNEVRPERETGEKNGQGLG